MHYLALKAYTLTIGCCPSNTNTNSCFDSLVRKNMANQMMAQLAKLVEKIGYFE
jgi:hypothetical protein